MEKIKVFYDKEGQTLTVWFVDPCKEYISEETGEEVIQIKDREGKVIGFEQLNVALEMENNDLSKTMLHLLMTGRVRVKEVMSERVQ